MSIALIALAITYAYWQITKTQQGVNEITTACLDISLEDAESGNTGVTLQDQYPISDTEGAALKPYKFTVTNNCDTSVDYQIALESTGDSTNVISASSIKVMLDSNTAATLLSSNEAVTPTVSGAYASYKLGMGTLQKSGEEGSSVTHELRLWIDEAAPVSENNKTYNGKITVTIGQGIKVEKEPIKEGSLAYYAVSSYGGEDNITEISDFSQVTAGMYKAADDYGTSYYYRGDVTNNYVKFAKQDNIIYLSPDNQEWESLEDCVSFTGAESQCTSSGETDSPIYWRIIRVNGDGTIRMVYAGTEPVGNSSVISLTGLPRKEPLESCYQDDCHRKMYVGYMYGTVDDPYGDNESTELTDSTMKDALDLWYEEILKTNYENYIADSIFCNDRSEYSNVDGFVIYFGSDRVNNVKPILTCANKRDRFTKDDVTNGNGDLTYPIATFTADELMMAGLNLSQSNSSTYFPSISDDGSGSLLSLTPDMFDGGFSIFFGLAVDTIAQNDPLQTPKMLPVINLKSDVAFTYNSADTAGTIDDPYVIVTD